MVKFLQELFPWLATLPFTAKFLISTAVVLIAVAVLVLVWASTPNQTNTPQPQLSVTATTEQESKPIWPKEKNLESLKRRLNRTSETNRKILQAIADTKNNGIYPDGLMKKFSLSRNDVLNRTKELESVGLIEILQLTDLNYRLHEDVWDTLGPNSKDLLYTLLK